MKTEFAEVIDWRPNWDTGAPMPQVFSNGYKTFLIYFINEHHPTWDSNSIKNIDDKNEFTHPLALVEFITPFTHRFGTVNDEVANGHPLYTKGLELYSAHIVQNSKWIEDLKSIHKVHPHFNEKNWIEKKHYLLFFHDQMFEIIARSFKIEIFKTTLLNLSTEAVKRLNAEQ